MMIRLHWCIGGYTPSTPPIRFSNDQVDFIGHENNANTTSQEAKLEKCKLCLCPDCLNCNVLYTVHFIMTEEYFKKFKHQPLIKFWANLDCALDNSYHDDEHRNLTSFLFFLAGHPAI